MKKLLIVAGAGAFIFFGALALPASAEESGNNQGFLADITAALAEIRNSIFSIQSDVTQLKEELSGLRQQIPVAASADAIKGVFKRGDSNAEIERIQRCLAGLGYGTFNGEFTTVFGSQTEEALKIFQNSEGIAPFGDIERGSGKFGPQTQARLNAVCKARGLLAPGQSAVISILGGGSSSFLSGSSSTSTLPLPDLRMTNLSASSTSGTTTNNWNFYGTVLNRSLANAGPSNTMLRIDVSNNGTWDIQRMNPTSPLSSGGSELESFLSIAMTVTGVHKYEICADALNAVVERSEANNCSSQIFASQGSLPVVTVAAVDPVATEPNDTGVFRIVRTGSTAAPLSVHFVVSGTAANGIDYQQIISPRIIPSGSATVDVTVVPIDDLLVEGTENVAFTLLPNVAYTIGTPGNSVVNIFDNDAPLADLITVNLMSTAATTSTSTIYNFFGTVFNQGNAIASSSETRLRLDFFSNGAWDVTQVAPTNSLAPGNAELEAWVYVATTTPGGHRFEVCADRLSWIAESNEANNCSTKTF